MDARDEALKAARDRFLAELHKYDDQRVTLTNAALDGFLKGLATRKEEQSDLLQKHCTEAAGHIREFDSITASMESHLALLSLNWSGLVNQANLYLLKVGMSIDPASPVPGESPLEAARRLTAGLENARMNLKRAGEHVDALLTNAVTKFGASLNGSSAIIILRRNTLEGFRRSHVMSSWEQIRTNLVNDLGDELSDAFAEEIKDQVVAELIKRGGELGASLAEQIPVIGAAGKLVFVFYKATRPPEKFSIVGGGDILLSLLSALRREERIYREFTDELGQAFDSVSNSINALA
jgi:hypothetical protein